MANTNTTSHEAAIRAEVRKMVEAGDTDTFIGYVRGLLGRDGAGSEYAVWALDEHRAAKFG